jgi:hypothetical protein
MSPPVQCTVTLTSPSSVTLTALPTRLRRIWRSLRGSVGRSIGSSGVWMEKVSPDRGEALRLGFR